MKIDLGDFEITNDTECFMLRTKAKTHTKAGKEYNQIIGWYPSLEALFDQLPERVLLKSEATTLKQVIEEVKQLHKLVTKHVNDN